MKRFYYSLIFWCLKFFALSGALCMKNFNFFPALFLAARSRAVSDSWTTTWDCYLFLIKKSLSSPPWRLVLVSLWWWQDNENVIALFAMLGRLKWKFSNGNKPCQWARWSGERRKRRANEEKFHHIFNAANPFHLVTLFFFILVSQCLNSTLTFSFFYYTNWNSFICASL